MPQRILVLLFALSCARLFASETGPGEADGTQPWMVAQDKGLVKGSFNPWKRGINLPPNAKIMVIPVHDKETSKEGMIDDWQEQFIKRRLQVAEREKYDLVILDIDTHGGELEACKRMVADVENCKVPVMAYVRNKAWSAGAILAMACKTIVMDPGAEIGSAKVVTLSGDLSTAMREKLDGVMRAMMTRLCDANGYPRAIGLGMVDSGIEVIETNDSNQRFMTDDEFAIAAKRGVTLIKKWKLKNQILALSAQQAVSAGLASGIASNTDELTLGLAAPSAKITRMEISTAETLARFLSNPIWRVLLVIVALIALFLEMKSPGHGVGYAVFAFCMGVFFWLQIFAHNAGLFELILFGLGALLVAVELFVLPAFGALGFGGIVMIVLSIVLAFLPEGSVPGLLGYSGKPNEYMMSQIVDGMQWATVTLLSVIGFFTLIWWKGVSLPGLNRLALNTVNSGTFHGGDGVPSAQQPAASDPAHGGGRLSGLAGVVGTAETMLRPAGKIRLDGVTYDAVSEGGFIEPGAAIYVLRAQGSALVVRLSNEPRSQGSG